ncbi:MAG: (4Fe-4S)-binding protein [Limnohabitans sp.]|nr:(4Fe-4S)-binding protein [Limnohabitans sp.]
MEKKYSNKDITIVWKPDACIHSTKCWKGENGLLSVFNPSVKPWINAEGATIEEIIKRINNCPSGALSYYSNQEQTPQEIIETEQIVEVLSKGPLMVYGNLKIKNADGTEIQRNKVTAFCRCGQSTNKPFCDGSHVKTDFEG